MPDEIREYNNYVSHPLVQIVLLSLDHIKATYLDLHLAKTLS